MSPDRRPTAAELMTGRAKPGQAPGAAPGPTPKPKAARPAPNDSRGRDLPAPAAGKTTRITVDLSPEDYEMLGRYIAELTPEFHRLSIARTLRAMIRAAPGDYKVTAAITAQLRWDQAAKR